MINAAFYMCALATVYGLSAAQTVSINTPRNGDTIAAGSTFTVEVQQSKIAGIVDEVSVLIGITPCPNSACSPATAFGPGTVLYNGEYNPVQTTDGSYEDFEVSLPASVETGENILTVFHVANTQEPGGSLIPVFDYTNVDIEVV